MPSGREIGQYVGERADALIARRNTDPINSVSVRAKCCSKSGAKAAGKVGCTDPLRASALKSQKR